LEGSTLLVLKIKALAIAMSVKYLSISLKNKPDCQILKISILVTDDDDQKISIICKINGRKLLTIMAK
jgi:hypothetical protein